VIVKESDLRQIIRDLIGERLTSSTVSEPDRYGQRYSWYSGEGYRDEAGELGLTSSTSGDTYDDSVPPGTTVAFPVVRIRKADKDGKVEISSAPRITSTAGKRRSPMSGASKLHRGWDIAARTGTPVVAYADGNIIDARPAGSAGNWIIIDHGFSWTDGDKSGPVKTIYMHLSDFEKTSGPVKAGQIIGYVGSTGRSTGPHLHFSFAIGEPSGGDPVPVKNRSFNNSLYSSNLDVGTALVKTQNPTAPDSEEAIIAENNKKLR
tara:strand:- start:8819 stop:9607 length:789 start_codon:yes stop_codon:yes gene_type:complete